MLKGNTRTSGKESNLHILTEGENDKEKLE